MKKCSGLKKGICITLAMVVLLSVVVTKEMIISKASRSLDKVFDNDQEVKVEQANGVYEYDREDNVLEDKYRNYYQIMVSHFCDSDGNGLGDINGITSKLNYIKDIGYNGIWLTPIFESNTSHKYNIRDYNMISQQFGTEEDFKKLVEECHKRGINIILDMVINHVDYRHQWFYEALKNPTPENMYYNYFNFTNKQEDDTYYNVNDYIKWYNNEYANYPQYQLALTEEELYVEAHFSWSMPDLNLQNPDVRKELEDITNKWLGYGIDGFRLDAALHYVNESKHDENIEVLKWYNDYVKSVNPNANIVGEVWTSDDTFQKYYKSGVDSFFDFSMAFGEGHIVKTVNKTSEIGKKQLIRQLIEKDRYNKRYNENAISAYFLSNHDQERTNKYLNDNEEKIKLARGLYQMLSGTTFTYYGEEIGMSGFKGIYGNDSSYRLGMYWSKEYAFEQPMSQGYYYYVINPNKPCLNVDTNNLEPNTDANEDSINVDNNEDIDSDTENEKCSLYNCTMKCFLDRLNLENSLHNFGSVEEQLENPNSILNYTKRILQLKNENPEISRGQMEVLDVDDNDILGIRKTYNGSSVIILINISDENKSFRFDKTKYDYSDIRGYATTDDTIVKLKKNKITMAKNAIVVLK